MADHVVSVGPAPAETPRGPLAGSTWLTEAPPITAKEHTHERSAER
jgi:hypothetical protein